VAGGVGLGVCDCSELSQQQRKDLPPQEQHAHLLLFLTCPVGTQPAGSMSALVLALQPVNRRCLLCGCHSLH
jgi:hypothetical protein